MNRYGFDSVEQALFTVPMFTLATVGTIYASHYHVDFHEDPYRSLLVLGATIGGGAFLGLVGGALTAAGRKAYQLGQKPSSPLEQETLESRL